MKKLKQPSLDAILRIGIRNIDDVAARIRDRLLVRMRSLWDSLDYHEIVRVARETLAETEPAIAAILGDGEIAAWVLGVDAVARTLPEAVASSLALGDRWQWFSPPKLSVSGDSPIKLKIIRNAVDDLISREIVTKKRFDQMLSDARKRAFTVAWQNSEKTISGIRDALTETIREGASLDRFSEKVGDVFDRSPLGWHRELVYRQNIQQAFSNGQDQIASSPIVSSVLPFALYSAIHDYRTRDDHWKMERAGLEGTAIYWADDNAVWSLFTPPWDWGCRCTKTFITRMQAADLGLKVAQKWIETGIEPPHESCRKNITWYPSTSYHPLTLVSA